MGNRPPLGATARLGQRLTGRARELADRLPGALAPPLAPGTPTPRVAIVGSGYGGLGMAIRLRQAGIETFTIYEKAQGVGGTWRDNAYPGAACDVPSHLYSLSFAPKADWTRTFPTQPEILGYLEGLVDEFELGPHLRFGAEIRELAWHDDTATWTLHLADGTTEEADAVVAATGQLSRPHIPAIPGLDEFPGPVFHSARWDHDLDLADRDVAVIGIGASAIQFVPQVAKEARTVTLFQRSANYVAPKPDKAISPEARRRFERSAALRRLYRFSIWARFDARWLLFRRRSKAGDLMAEAFRKKLRPLVGDELTEAAVIPDYPVGCKRILIANDWYPTLLRPNVQVVTDRVERVAPGGVVAGGTEHRADTIIFGTGFTSTAFLAPIRVTGREGRELSQEWAAGAEAHLGIGVSGFPNLFLLYGPNTNLGHNSIVFMLERQIAYVLTLLRRSVDEQAGAAEVRPEAQAASNAWLRRRLDRTVWAADCHSWYKTEGGRITNNWGASTLVYWWRTLVPRQGDITWRRPTADRTEEPVPAHSGHR